MNGPSVSIQWNRRYLLVPLYGIRMDRRSSASKRMRKGPPAQAEPVLTFRSKRKIRLITPAGLSAGKRAMGKFPRCHDTWTCRGMHRPRTPCIGDTPYNPRRGFAPYPTRRQPPSIHRPRCGCNRKEGKAYSKSQTQCKCFI